MKILQVYAVILELYVRRGASYRHHSTTNGSMMMGHCSGEYISFCQLQVQDRAGQSRFANLPFLYSSYK